MRAEEQTPLPKKSQSKGGTIMKLNETIKRRLPFAAAVIISSLAQGPALMAQNNLFQQSCTDSTLQGDYGFAVSGMKPSSMGGPMETMIGTAMTRFDGSGNLTQTDNIHGSISGYPAPDRPGTGTYTVNPDCTGVMTINAPGSPPLTGRIVVVDNGNEVRVAIVNPLTVMVTSNGRRVTPPLLDGGVFLLSVPGK